MLQKYQVNMSDRTIRFLRQQTEDALLYRELLEIACLVPFTKTVHNRVQTLKKAVNFV